MIRHFFSRQFVSFLGTGGVAAGVNFSSRIVYDLWFGFSTSIVLAYGTGMLTAFFLARIFVFKNSQNTFLNSMFLFFLVNLIALLQTWLISIAMVNYVLPGLGVVRFVPEIAHGAGVAFPAFTSFIGHKFWSFR